MTPDARRRTVLVAGGTRGLGRAIGLAFAQQGARVILTHRWGSVDPEELSADFERTGAAEPEVIEADVANPDDTRALLQAIGEPVDVFVSNVCVVGRGAGTFSGRDLQRSLDYSAWPLLRYVDALRDAFGAPPAYVVATSSDGPDRFYPGYDYVAASKAVLEALCRRLAQQYPEMRINALRARQVDTTGYREMFGAEARDIVARFARFDLDPYEVAQAALALCSGDLDGLSGEVLTVDRGATPLDNLVNVAPALLGGSAPWEQFPPSSNEVQRANGVLWIDAGVRPGAVDLCRPAQVISATDVGAIDADRLPDCIVLGCDWSQRALDDQAHVAVLPELLDRAVQQGRPVRYGVRVDRGGDVPAPGETLAASLDLYWGSWHSAVDTRLNAVRFTDDRHHSQAIAAVRALLSGSLDAVRGQTLNVSKGSAA